MRKELGVTHAALGASAGAGDATWSKPKKLGGNDASNAGLTGAHDGSLIVVWDESAG